MQPTETLRPDRARSTPLHVVVVCDHAHVSGGLAQVAHASARALSAKGHAVTFFSAVPPIDAGLSETGVRVVCLDQPDMLGDSSQARAAGRALWNITAARRLTELLRDLDPTTSIVHIHGWSKALSPSVLHAASRSGVPTVHTLHDYVALCPNGAFYNYVKEQNCPLKPMSAACIGTNCDTRHFAHKLWRVARQAALLATKGVGGVNDMIYMLESQRAIAAPHLPPHIEMHCVPNPVGVADRGPTPVAQFDAFVFIGRLSREKGVVLFAEAAARAGVKAIFVGDGPARQEIEAVAPTATITGWVGNDVVAQYLQRARAVVFPSLWYETFGLSVYEALASGVPPIVSDNTVSSGAIEHGVNGLLFRNGDVADLAARIVELRDGDTAARQGRVAYERYWREPLTLERHVSRLEDVYQAVIAKALAPNPRARLEAHTRMTHPRASNHADKNGATR